MRKRTLARLLAAAVLLLSSACGGGGAARPGAYVDVTVRPDGAVLLDLRVGGASIRTDAGLTTLCAQIARAVFPAARRVQVTTKDSPGYPTARAAITDAYQPGRSVSASIDTSAMWAVLARRGLTEAWLRLTLPSVPTTVTSSARPESPYRWLLRRDRRAPSIALVMRPEPARWFGEMALLIFTLGCATVTVVWRRRPAMAATAAAALAGALATGATAGARQGDNLGVAGISRGIPLAAATAAPLLTLALGLLAVAFAALRTITHARRGPGAASLRSDSTGVPTRN